MDYLEAHGWKIVGGIFLLVSTVIAILLMEWVVRRQEPDTPRWKLRLIPLPFLILVIANFANLHLSEADLEVRWGWETPDTDYKFWNSGKLVLAGFLMGLLVPFLYSRRIRKLLIIVPTFWFIEFGWMMFPFFLFALMSGVPLQQ